VCFRSRLTRRSSRFLSCTRACEIAYELVGEGLGVGRVIARPFVGTAGAFTRTANRHDYALPPSGETLLDRVKGASIPVVAIGKIEDLFAGRGITQAFHTASDDDGMNRTEEQMEAVDRGFIFTNLVDFDTQYGHRNDVEGYARNLERFDARLARVLPRLRSDDLLAVTADHGNDPTTPSTDHAREYVPLMVTGARVRRGLDLGVRKTFADLGQTLAELFGVGHLAHGTSFLSEITSEERKRRSPQSMICLRPVRALRATDMSSLRQQLEAREREILAPQAAKSADSRGRLRAEAEDDVRPAFQRDRDRIIHCKAFRRLKHKTQVFFAPTGDHYRTRLTHTLEVSQIARTIAKVLRLHEELTEAIALGHDLGHTPFGHAGERVIDTLMPGGFNHYEQSLRIVDTLENDGRGLNLTWEVRDGIAKHSKGSPAHRSACRSSSDRARSKGRSCASPTSSPT